MENLLLCKSIRWVRYWAHSTYVVKHFRFPFHQDVGIEYWLRLPRRCTLVSNLMPKEVSKDCGCLWSFPPTHQFSFSENNFLSVLSKLHILSKRRRMKKKPKLQFLKRAKFFSFLIYASIKHNYLLMTLNGIERLMGLCLTGFLVWGCWLHYI